MKRKIAGFVAAAMTCGMTASIGVPVMADDEVSFSIFNSKNEIQEQLEKACEAYGEEHGVHIEVYYSNDTISAHLSTKYAANDPYTLMMVDEKDVYALNNYAADLTGEKWSEDTNYAISVDDQVKGFPVCIEARGLLYNANAIEEITGEEFVPEDYATLDAFTELLDTLVAGGMEYPTAVQKEDWSLAAHYFQQVYEQREDPDAFVKQLYAGDVDLMNDDKFNSIMDSFDVLLKYNYAQSGAAGAERQVSQQMLAEGEIAFLFDGCWAWGDVKDFDYTDKLGQMPLPQNTDDESNVKLVGGGSKFFMIDSSDNTTDEQRQAAKDFLNWLVYDEEGQKFISVDCDMISPFENNDCDVVNPFGQSVKKYADENMMISNYSHDPDDHISMVGASMQKYVAGVIDREELAEEIEKYWASTEPVEE